VQEVIVKKTEAQATQN